MADSTEFNAGPFQSERLERDLKVWRQQFIEIAVFRGRPLQSVTLAEVPESFSPDGVSRKYDLERDFFPPENEESFDIPGRDEEIRLGTTMIGSDVDGSDEFNDAIDTLRGQPSYPYLPMVCESFKNAAIRFVQGGHYGFALAALLNLRRILGDDHAHRPGLDAAIGHCLMSLGWLEQSCRWMDRSATEGWEDSSSSAQNLLASKSLEVAALLHMKLPTQESYDKAVLDFRRAAVLYRKLGRVRDVSRCVVMEDEAYRLSLSSRKRKFGIGIFKFIWLYGYSPFLVVLWIMAIWISFGGFFMYAGFEIHSVPINYDIAWTIDASAFGDFGNALYFSAVTLTTLGYGDAQPVAGWSRFWAGTEAFLGVVFIAMFLVALQRRFVSR